MLPYILRKMCIVATYGFVYMYVAQDRLWYSFFNHRRQTTLSSMHSMQVWVSKRFYVSSCENVQVYVCVYMRVCTLIIHALMSPQRNIGFQKLYKLLTIGYLRHSSHVLIYIFHYVIILAILSGDTKYNLIIALVLYIAWATKRFLMIMFVATDGIYETHNEGWHRY